ncbi:MAG TPA: hypothetical protein PLP23_14615 [Panacibacter sp.]|nr:hypothetical protein [Panacibacter sp.]
MKKDPDLELKQAASEFMAAIIIDANKKITYAEYCRLHYYISAELQHQLQKLVIYNPGSDNQLPD